MVDFGYFCIILAFFITIYNVASLSLGIRRNSFNMIYSAKIANIMIFLLSGIAYLVLTVSFIGNNFSVDFVYRNSNIALPLFYKITGVWGGMDGSLLLWQFVLSLYVMVASIIYRKSNPIILPHALIVLNFIMMFLLFLLATYSNPLARNFTLVDDGQGLNPLLQHPAMAFHPPSLYLGFIGLSMPFAFAIGSLMAGRFNNEWILITRRWTLVAWFFLTLGMLLGGQWAYHELGWGGYWAWDPVENSSLLPWLTTTAFLHSAMVQEKRNGLKIWNMILIIITFELTLLGTFITRSGLLNSVHAFAESNVGPVFLIAIAIGLVVSFGLLFYRLPQLESKQFSYRIVNKENVFIMNNFLLIGITFTVLYGTLFPIIAEGLADKKLSIQAPFFNKITAPFSMIILILMGTAPFLAWNKANMASLRKQLFLPFCISILLMVVAYFFFLSNYAFALFSGIIYFAFHAVVLELLKTSRASLRRVEKSASPQRKFKELFRNRQVWGGMLAHIAIIFVFIGICGNFFVTEKTFTIGFNETETIGDYSLFYRINGRAVSDNVTEEFAEIDVYKNNELLTTLKPSKAFYVTSNEPTTEVAIYKTIKEDLYLTLISTNTDNSVTIDAYINPLIIFVQSSIFIFTLGMLFSFSYQPARLNKN